MTKLLTIALVAIGGLLALAHDAEAGLFRRNGRGLLPRVFQRGSCGQAATGAMGACAGGVCAVR